jgi:putative transposase
MPRAPRIVEPGLVYHVLNRANARLPIFHKHADYDAFERVLAEALAEVPMRLLSYCVLPNHWHLVLWPPEDPADALSRFVGWLTLTHTQRWHAHYHNVGHGHLYQGRFKSFPVAADEHLLTVCRYVERNALRAGLLGGVRSCGAGAVCGVGSRAGGESQALWSAWPVSRLANWLEWVNEPQTRAEEEAVRTCIRRGRPYGSAGWVEGTARRLGLTQTLRPQGRPRKSGKEIEK